MKNLTEKKLEAALFALSNAPEFAPFFAEGGNELAKLVSTIKVGADAKYHLASEGVVGYFAIEESILSATYYDARGRWFEIATVVNRHLPGFLVEPINHVEFGIYPD